MQGKRRIRDVDRNGKKPEDGSDEREKSDKCSSVAEIKLVA
jgi:hypothetical protein